MAIFLILCRKFIITLLFYIYICKYADVERERERENTYVPNLHLIKIHNFCYNNNKKNKKQQQNISFYSVGSLEDVFY